MVSYGPEGRPWFSGLSERTGEMGKLVSFNNIVLRPQPVQVSDLSGFTFSKLPGELNVSRLENQSLFKSNDYQIVVCMNHICTMEYYSIIRKDEILHLRSWMDLENITRS